MGGVDRIGAPWCPGDGNQQGGPQQLRWGPALGGGGEGCITNGREGLDDSDHIAHQVGGSVATRARCIDAPVEGNRWRQFPRAVPR
jgi:hypothetical protein